MSNILGYRNIMLTLVPLININQSLEYAVLFQRMECKTRKWMSQRNSSTMQFLEN